jgi:hypothetical protein
VVPVELERKLTPGKVLKQMKKSVAESTLVTTTKEAYELSVVHERASRGGSLEYSPYDIQESDLSDEEEEVRTAAVHSSNPPVAPVMLGPSLTDCFVIHMGPFLRDCYACDAADR